MNVKCPNAPAVLHPLSDMGRLPPWGGTGIDHRHAGLCPKDMRHKHRALILHLRQPLAQRRERIERTVRMQENALGDAQ